MKRMDLKTYLSGGRGRLTSLSKAIGAHAPDVSRWASGDRPVPIPFGLPIENATGGLVTRQEMFPEETLAKVWPDLVKAKNGKVDRAAASDDTQPPAGTKGDEKLSKMVM
jgi:DNA-binding transcriptional regulator YdaS (Cro superfamily)